MTEHTGITDHLTEAKESLEYFMYGSNAPREIGHAEFLAFSAVNALIAIAERLEALGAPAVTVQNTLRPEPS